MTKEEIRERFLKAVNDKVLIKQIESTKYQRYQWRNPDKYNLGLGIMLEVLFKLGLIRFKDESD